MTYGTRGQQQVAKYGESAERLVYTVTDDYGRQQAPDAAPNITIYDTGGTERVAVTAMTVNASTTEGFLRYDAQTAEFTVGQVLTGGTSSATALIVGQVKTGATGVLQLADIAGTFQNNETITDGLSGSATANLTLYQAEYYYNLDCSSTSTYGIGRNYSAKVEYALSSRAYERWFYFDIQRTPATAPWVTHTDIIKRYPHLVGAEPEQWGDWTPAITAAHADLIRKLRSLGEMADWYVRRDDEMWGIEMHYVRAEIARAMMEPQERIDYWEQKASEAWASRGEFTYDTDEDQEVDEDVKVVGSKWTR